MHVYNHKIVFAMFPIRNSDAYRASPSRYEFYWPDIFPY